MRSKKHIVKTLTTVGLVLAILLSPLSAFAQVGDNSISGGDPQANDAAARQATQNAARGIAGTTAGLTNTTPANSPNNPISSTSGSGGSASDCSGITGCLASMVYWIGPGFASWAASWAAYFFDLIVRISLMSDTYSLTFLSQVWTTVLSLANMFFIFILIYAAFVIMLRAETARTLQTLAWVVAIALVVNFSFFFTRVVIDAGNIIGVQFYNAVAFDRTSGNPIATLDPNGQTSVAGTPDITAPLMKAIGVETLLGANSFNSISSALGSSWSALLIMTVVFLFAAVMFWVLAIALLLVGLKFFLRVVGLWLVLVASPLAFVAQTLSNSRKFFDMWLRTLISFSVYPAVFLFMFWVLNQFAVQLGSGLQGFLTSANGQMQAAAGSAGQVNPYPLLVLIANVSIRMMFIITMLYIMLKVSDWIIEQAGGIASTFMNRGAAIVAGGGFRGAAAFGAFAGRNTAGRLANGLANNSTFAASAKNNIFARTLWRGTAGLSRSTYDMRNAPAGTLVRKGVESVTGALNIGKPSSKNAAERAERIAKLNKRMERIARKAKKDEAEKEAAVKEADKREEDTRTNASKQLFAQAQNEKVQDTASKTRGAAGLYAQANKERLNERESKRDAANSLFAQARQENSSRAGAAHTLFMQAQGEKIKKSAQIGAVAATLHGTPDMSQSKTATLEVPKHLEEKMTELTESVQGLTHAVGAVKEGKPITERVRVNVPAHIPSATDKMDDRNAYLIERAMRWSKENAEKQKERDIKINKNLGKLSNEVNSIKRTSPPDYPFDVAAE